MVGIVAKTRALEPLILNSGMERAGSQEAQTSDSRAGSCWIQSVNRNLTLSASSSGFVQMRRLLSNSDSGQNATQSQCVLEFHKTKTMSLLKTLHAAEDRRNSKFSAKISCRAAACSPSPKASVCPVRCKWGHHPPL